MEWIINLALNIFYFFLLSSNFDFIILLLKSTALHNNDFC